MFSDKTLIGSLGNFILPYYAKHHEIVFLMRQLCRSTRLASQEKEEMLLLAGSKRKVICVEYGNLTKATMDHVTKPLGRLYEFDLKPKSVPEV